MNLGYHRKTKGEETETNDEAQDRRRSWHFDRSINVPFLASLAIFCIVQILAAFAYIQTQDRRMTREEVRGDNQDKADIALKEDIKVLKGDLREDLKRIEKKLDDSLDKGRRR